VGVLDFYPPWRDLRRYVEARLKEAEWEAKLAEEFLENGLLRNAAGKAFQAWKAVLAAAAALARELVEERVPGFVVDRLGKRRRRADIVIALMPTSKMRAVAGALAERFGWEVVYLTSLALDLHEFQYNGVDPEGVASRYTDVRDVERDVRHLAEKAREWAAKLKAF